MMTVLEAPVASADEICIPDCVGFRVYSHDGYEGVVERVLRDPSGRPATIRVRSGLFVPRTTVRPAAAASAHVARRVVVLAEDPA
jgi:hypothetical protein